MATPLENSNGLPESFFKKQKLNYYLIFHPYPAPDGTLWSHNTTRLIPLSCRWKLISG